MTSYCWVKDTYYLPWSKRVPKYQSEPRQMVPYYQWMPFILLLQVSRMFLPARCYASAGTSYGPCPCLRLSVCLSVTSLCFIEIRAYSKEFFGVHNFKSSCMM